MNARNEVERNLLACAVMDPSVIDMYGARISHRDWWRPQHAALWAKLRELRDDARYANLDQGWFDVVVGEAFSWGEAVNGGAYVAALPAVCTIARSRWLLRRTNHQGELTPERP